MPLTAREQQALDRFKQYNGTVQILANGTLIITVDFPADRASHITERDLRHAFQDLVLTIKNLYTSLGPVEFAPNTVILERTESVTDSLERGGVPDLATDLQNPDAGYKIKTVLRTQGPAPNELMRHGLQELLAQHSIRHTLEPAPSTSTSMRPRPPQ